MAGSAPAGIEGVSLVPFFTGKAANTDISYAETLFPRINLGWAELRGIRTNRWKYIRAPRPELYDLTRDPGETDNVIGDNPAEVRKLEAHITAGSEKIETSTLDERTLAQLKSLGYTSGFSARSYDLNGQGPDPKDRVAVLKLMDAAERPGSGVSEPRRIELLQQAVRLDQRNPLLYYSLGSRLEKAGRYEDAMKLYRTAAAKGIENGRLHSRL